MAEPKYEPRTAENVLRAELASIDQSIAFQQRRISRAVEQKADAESLLTTHTMSRQHIIAALRHLELEVPA